MELKDKNGNWDWWKVFGGLLILGGVISMLTNFAENNFWGGLTVGGVNILAGAAIWRESLPVFRLVRIIFLGAMFFLIIGLLTSVPIGLEESSVTVDTHPLISMIGNLIILLNMATLGSLIMLWRKLRIEKKINW